MQVYDRDPPMICFEMTRSAGSVGNQCLPIRPPHESMILWLAVRPYNRQQSPKQMQLEGTGTISACQDDDSDQFEALRDRRDQEPVLDQVRAVTKV